MAPDRGSSSCWSTILDHFEVVTGNQERQSGPAAEQ